MSKVILTIFIMSFSASMAIASSVQLIGYVPNRIDVQVENQITFLANSDFIIESLNTTGQTERHFLQYSEKLSLNKNNITKVTVYAP